MPKAMTTIHRHPQGGSQPEDHQTQYREEDLLHHGAGNDGLRIAVDDRDLDDGDRSYQTLSLSHGIPFMIIPQRD